LLPIVERDEVHVATTFETAPSDGVGIARECRDVTAPCVRLKVRILGNRTKPIGRF
jgi:hypothetical protein